MLVDQDLASGSPYSFLADLERKCPGSLPNRALIAKQLTTEELISALSLQCKILFKPVNDRELASWFQEVVERIPEGRRLAELP